jgi:galactokinase
VLCDTKVKHSLVDSEYNARRRECEAGVKILQKFYPEVKSLRDASADMLKKHDADFPVVVYKRCLYVVEEIARVQQASADLDKVDLRSFGDKMFETHRGLSKLYEVSCKELDFLVAEAKVFQGVAGSRMMGGGFGGCTINLIEADKAERFMTHMKERYRTEFDIDMPAYQVKVVDGTSRVKEEALNLWT